MKYAIAIRNMGPQSTRSAIRECARAAEDLGYDALFFSDHLCIPPDQTEGSGGRYLDAVTALAFVAGVTDRIRIGVSVLVLPYRPMVLTAKQLATIQELSGERVILGVGSGWMKPEFEALGVDFKKRGRITDETLRIFHHLFSNDAAPFEGDLVKFPAFVFAPRPKRPPIWIGGNGAKAQQRVIEFGDGWHPMLRNEELRKAVDLLKKGCAAAGRPVPEIVVRRAVKEDADAAKKSLDEAAESGASYFIVDFGRYADSEEFSRRATAFAQLVDSKV